MPDSYIGQVQLKVSGAVDPTEPWTDVIENDDKDYVLHCLQYEKYKDMPRRIVQLLTYVI